jgi:uncharacterized membrane protein YhfC
MFSLGIAAPLINILANTVGSISFKSKKYGHNLIVFVCGNLIYGIYPRIQVLMKNILYKNNAKLIILKFSCGNSLYVKVNRRTFTVEAFLN